MFEKEAEDNKPPYACCALVPNCTFWKDGFQKGAEPREKRITALEQENTELKNHHENVCKNLTDTHRNIREQFANAVLIIKNLLHLWEDVMTEDTVKAMIAEAKQFLKETGQ